MNWINTHHILLGILADFLTFLGGCLLARDAFLRMQEVKRKRVDQAFSRQFPELNLTDEEWKAALVSMKWTLGGFVLMVAGFLLQLLLRVFIG